MNRNVNIGDAGYLICDTHAKNGGHDPQAALALSGWCLWDVRPENKDLQSPGPGKAESADSFISLLPQKSTG